VRINVIGGKGVRKLPLFKRKELVQRRDLHEGMKRQKQSSTHTATSQPWLAPNATPVRVSKE
jgi:hypothetical protein